MPQSHIELPRFDLLAAGTSIGATAGRCIKDAEVAVEFTPRLLCNDLMLLRQAVLSELGIASLPAFLCKRDLAEGRLVEVLPGWQAADMQFFALFADPRACRCGSGR